MFNCISCQTLIISSIVFIFLSIEHTVCSHSDDSSAYKFSPVDKSQMLSNRIKQNLRTDAENLTSSTADSSLHVTVSDNAVIGQNQNVTTGNFSIPGTSPKWLMSINSGALQRTGFVALGVMLILLIFFVIRAVRINQKKSKSRKYGIITSTVNDMEMQPLDRGDDDEEDTTLFDAQHKYRIK